MVFARQPSIPLPTAVQMTESTLPDNLRNWKTKWTDFVMLTHLDSFPMPYQLAMFRLPIGDEARSVLETLERGDAEEQEPDISEIIKR
ncbi:unnamed protein product, partial [Dicrocoelium dendriticum]